MELVESKEKPWHEPAKPHRELGKTVRLFLQLTKSLRNISNLVVMNSGFCVLKDMIELKKVIIFSLALINKCR